MLQPMDAGGIGVIGHDMATHSGSRNTKMTLIFLRTRTAYFSATHFKTLVTFYDLFKNKKSII